ncbi:phospholipase A2 inhibitor beta-like [Daphnia carinata]|uniref:phospholipase A2 inhibitor beta-like n=1 Tax=Daphnia carinata TaxID=120202 RepID=UPI00257C0BD0|nr:phospholipase A2 inhibitor beta-like [Daphnia carinata]
MKTVDILLFTLCISLSNVKLASGRNIEWWASDKSNSQKTDRNLCVEDYSPCNCNDSPSYGLEITCDGVDVLTIQDIFSRTTTNDLFSFQLTVPSPAEGNVVSIPADLLNGKRAGNILLNCPFPDWQLTIDADAFRPSSDLTFFFFTAGCDLNLLDFTSFLDGFLSLTTVFISQSSNVQGIQNLPALPSLNQLIVTYTTGLEKITDFSRLGNVQLRRLLLNGNQLDDQMADNILNAMASSSAATALEMLWLASNQLTRVPAQLSSFSRLIQLDLSNNSFPVLSSGSFSFNAPVDYLYLESNTINSIEPSAFQGDFTRGRIYLRFNSLSRFEEAVFRPLLEQMISVTNGGLVNLESNPLDCGDCHLAWLIRDSPSLLNAVESAVCSDGTAFSALNPSAFADCP